ncbi:MAG: SDR family oxidoreductase [Tepidanaerobacteraceae bacterium]
MNIVVTGGAGFIGSNLVDRLIEEGHKVVVIDNLSRGEINNVHSRAKFYHQDICSTKIRYIFRKEKIDIVYHGAAQIDVQKSIKDPMFDCDVNILGTVNVLEACKEANVEKIIYSSSAAVYGKPKYLGIDENHPINPISFYGISKYIPEYYLRVYNALYNLDYTILRYANVYGIRQKPNSEGGVIAIFLNKLLKNESPIIFGDGDATRDFIFVEDVVEANIKALHNGSKEVFNIGTGKATLIKELFFLMKDIIKTDVEVRCSKERKGDTKHSFFDITKAKEKLNWMPKYELREGLKMTIEYYKRLLTAQAMDEVAATRENESDK